MVLGREGGPPAPEHYLKECKSHLQASGSSHPLYCPRQGLPSVLGSLGANAQRLGRGSQGHSLI